MAGSSNSGMGLDASISELLECPVCLTLMYPPIYQCSNGHVICFKCKDEINDCPICREKLGNIRCLALDKVAEKLKLPCKFHYYGCPIVLSYQTRLEHEKTCQFFMFNCPYNVAGCSVIGDIESLVSHLKERHEVVSLNRRTFSTVYAISDANEREKDMWMFELVNCFDHQFYLQFEAFSLGNSPVFMASMRFMGEETEAKKFKYSLAVGGNKRKMMWQGVPRSIRDSRTSARDNLDGLIIQKKLAISFSTDRQGHELRVTARIWRVET